MPSITLPREGECDKDDRVPIRMMLRRAKTRFQLVLRLTAGITIGVLVAAALLDFNGEPLFAFDETDRIVPASRFGVNLEQATALARFRRPLAEGDDAADNERLRQQLTRDYQLDRAILDDLGDFSTERERLVAYLLLRVNGSVPVFDPSKQVGPDRGELMRSRAGNCSHLAARLAVVLELFGLRCRVVSWWSPAMEGHVFVGAVDPADGAAYYLDATSNLMARFEPGEGGAKGVGDERWFLDRLGSMTPEQRRGYLEARMRQFPCLFSGLAAAELDSSAWANNNALRARDSALSAFSYGLPIARAKWESGEQPAPMLTAEFLALHGVESVGDGEGADDAAAGEGR